jgi:hypothetical protein
MKILFIYLQAFIDLEFLEQSKQICKTQSNLSSVCFSNLSLLFELIFYYINEQIKYFMTFRATKSSAHVINNNK